MNPAPVCAVVGAGPGNGLAFGQRFAAAGYRVALLARDPDTLQALASRIGPDCLAIPCDVTDPDAITRAHAQLCDAAGAPDVLIYNAGAGVFGSIDEVSAADFETAWRINTAGLLHWTQAVLPQMRRNGRGRIIVIGATASKRGGANFTAFASAKHAQYGLAQSLARKLGPENIHVSYVIVDGVIDTPRTRTMLPGKPDAFFLDANAIADSVFHLSQQPASARSFEIDLRPGGETW